MINQALGDQDTDDELEEMSIYKDTKDTNTQKD
jgi:hypothetical protein